jgi:hypothetical protein
MRATQAIRVKLPSAMRSFGVCNQSRRPSRLTRAWSNEVNGASFGNTSRSRSLKRSIKASI